MCRILQLGKWTFLEGEVAILFISLCKLDMDIKLTITLLSILAYLHLL